jgi:hypothetical protein
VPLVDAFAIPDSCLAAPIVVMSTWFYLLNNKPIDSHGIKTQFKTKYSLFLMTAAACGGSKIASSFVLATNRLFFPGDE